MSLPFWVLDTNVLVSAALTPGGVCDQLLHYAVAGHFVPAWDNLMLREYRDVLARPKFRLSQDAITELLSAFPQVGFCRGVICELDLPDANDLPFVRVALATMSKTMITGNPKHFVVPETLEINILSPREALGYLTTQV